MNRHNSGGGATAQRANHICPACHRRHGPHVSVRRPAGQDRRPVRPAWPRPRSRERPCGRPGHRGRGDRAKPFTDDGLHKTLRWRATLARIVALTRTAPAHRRAPAPGQDGSEGGLTAVASRTRLDLLMRYPQARAAERSAAGLALSARGPVAASGEAPWLALQRNLSATGPPDDDQSSWPRRPVETFTKSPSWPAVRCYN